MLLGRIRKEGCQTATLSQIQQTIYLSRYRVRANVRQFIDHTFPKQTENLKTEHVERAQSRVS